MSRRAALVALSLVAATAACAGPRPAIHAPAPAPASTPDVVLGVTGAEQLGVVVDTAIGLLDGTPVAAAHVTIVACGPAAHGLVADAPSAPAIQRALSRGVDVAVCGITLDRAGIAAARLVHGVRVAPNGLAEVVRLEARGYLGVML